MTLNIFGGLGIWRAYIPDLAHAHKNFQTQLYNANCNYALRSCDTSRYSKNYAVRLNNTIIFDSHQANWRGNDAVCRAHEDRSNLLSNWSLHQAMHQTVQFLPNT